MALEQLNLASNRLVRLPEDMSNLNRLQLLYLPFNDLTAIPESLFDTENLRDINVSRNQITKLPETVSKLTTLQYLYLSDNQLTSLPVDELRKIGGLKVLSVVNNEVPLTQIDELKVALPNTIVNY